MKVVRLADRNSDLVLTCGETFEVRLPENATTGYQWSVAQLPDAVALVEDDTAVPDVLLPGAAGEHRFRFVVRGSPGGADRAFFFGRAAGRGGVRLSVGGTPLSTWRV